MDVMRISVCLAIMVLACGSVSAQFREGAAYEDLYDSETVSSMKDHVRFLSAASLEGRLAGSEGEKEAAGYVADIFREYGIEVITPSTGEEFGLRKADGDTLTSRNVIGYVEGYDRNLKNRFIVVGARLDNMGTMTTYIDGTPVERICYGANGNASGLSVMLELARMVKTNSVLFRRSVLFVAFGASMETFAGAWYFLNRSFSSSDKIDAMVNLDMLGTGYNGFYAYTSSNTDLNNVLSSLAGELHPIYPEMISYEPYPSDHRAFYSAEIPSVLFTTGRYPERNTDRDTQSIIDYPNMERELEYVYNFTRVLANLPDAPSFRDISASASASGMQDDVVSYNECDQPPMFLNSPDPRKFLMEWVYRYVKYPEAALRDGVQGRVMVDFIIEKDGKVSDVRIAKGVSEELDAEAVKVVSASPKWKPGRVNGNKVRTSMTIPVEFKLEKKTSKPDFGIRR